jgi:hypothetical protein
MLQNEVIKGGERMCKKIIFGALLVFVQGVINDELEVRALRGRGGHKLTVRHDGEIRWLVRTREDNGGFTSDAGGGRGQRGTLHWALHCVGTQTAHPISSYATIGFLLPLWPGFSKLGENLQYVARSRARRCGQVTI